MAKKSNSIFNKTSRCPVLLLGCLLFLAIFLAKMRCPSLDDAWGHGFAHPLEGWDHIVTMLAVGIWAAQLRGHAVWLLPLVFVSVMSLGGIAGTAGILLPAVETMILLSCAVFSLFIVRRVKFSSQVNLTIVAFFAFFHGFAHGQEISASASLLSYTVGFMLATLLLHGAGILIAKLILFCLTCFLAVLLPSLAQAAQTQSISKSDSSYDPVVRLMDVSQNSPWHQAISPHFPVAECYAVNDFNITFLSLCAIIPDKSDQASPALKPQTHSSTPMHSSKEGRLDHVSGKLTLNKTNIATLTKMPPYSVLILQDDKPNFAAVFKHYYPDINYTPGQVLLSNGVGSTSPPLALIARITIYITRLYNTHLVPAFEDRALQSILTKSSKSLSALLSTSISQHFKCVVALTDSAYTSFRRIYSAACKLKGRDYENDEVSYLHHTTRG